MKKIYFSLLALVFVAGMASAQDLTSKKGIPILPEAGEIGLSIDAVPFFVYAGNLFNGNSFNNAPTWSFPDLGHAPMFTIGAKYFTDAKTALRGQVRLGFFSTTIKNTLPDQTDVTGMAKVDDRWIYSTYDISLGAGIEKRKGKGRVQGVYGFMVNFMLSKENNKVKYGNSITADYTTPASTNYPWVEDDGGYQYSPATSRIIRDNGGLVVGGGISAFLGIEYFFAPKMSIGGEFSLAGMIAVVGKDKTETEYWDPANSTVKTLIEKRGGEFIIGIDNTNSGGAINLNFYF